MKPFPIEFAPNTQSHKSGELRGKNKGVPVQGIENRLAGKMIGIKFKAPALLAENRHGESTFQVLEPIMMSGSGVSPGDVGPGDLLATENIPRKCAANMLIVMKIRPHEGSLRQGRHGVADPRPMVKRNRTSAKKIQGFTGLFKPSIVTQPVTDDSEETWHLEYLSLAIQVGSDSDLRENLPAQTIPSIVSCWQRKIWHVFVFQKKLKFARRKPIGKFKIPRGFGSAGGNTFKCRIQLIPLT